MKRTRVWTWAGVVLLSSAFCLQGQESTPPQANAAETSSAQATTTAGSAAGTVVPRLVRFSGLVTGTSGRAVTGIVAITFSLYELQEGGAPLWSETQTLALDSQGHYTALLGAASPDGLPLDLFASGSARWLGVAPALPGMGEQSRVLLVGVPYALKAADADTLGGKPASAFVTTDAAGVEPGLSPAAGISAQGNAGRKAGATGGAKPSAKTPASNVTGSGTTNYVPLWTGSTTLGNSALFQVGSGSTAMVGIGTASPTNVLQVNGTSPIYSTGAGAGLEFQDRAGGSNASGEWYSSGNVDYFYRTDKGNVLSVTSAGYVGMGTSSPGVNLQVAGTTSTSNIQIRASNLATSGSSISYVGADANAGKTVVLVGADGLGTGPLKTASGFFGTFTNQPAGIVTNNTERLRVTTTGAVGIGTTSPAVNLQVVGSSTPQIRVSNPATSNSSISYIGADANAGQTVALVGADGLGTGPMNTASGFFGTFTNQPAGIITNDVERMRVTTTGAVGIGTTTPAATLEVNGTAKFDQSVTFTAFQAFPNTAGLNANRFSGTQTINSGSGSAVVATATTPLVVSVTNALSGGTGIQSVTSAGEAVFGKDTGGGYGVYGQGGTGVYGTTSAGGLYGVYGNSTNASGAGIYGTTSIGTYGVYGVSASYGVAGTGAIGVFGSTATNGSYGVEGTDTSTSGGYAVYGASNEGSGVYGNSLNNVSSGVFGIGYDGVYGVSGGGAGVFGEGSAGSPGVYGAYYDGEANPSYGSLGTAVAASPTGAAGTDISGSPDAGGGFGVFGESINGTGVYAETDNATGYGLWVFNNGSVMGTGATAGYFVGDVFVTGNVSSMVSSVKIDHPLDPANKYLYHSSVESPDMMNIYNGNVVLDSAGEAWVSLPDWFEALNKDFRYQLTAIGAPAPGLYVADEISGNRFRIAGGKPGGKVSWQVTGVRQDRWAQAHRIPVEADKSAAEKGLYLRPELYGQPKEKGVNWARRPQKPPRVPALPHPTAKVARVVRGE